MTDMRRRILLLVALVGAPVAVMVAPAPPAQAFCDTSEGCSPCGPEIVVQGKNTRINWVQC